MLQLLLHQKKEQKKTIDKLQTVAGRVLNK